MMIYSIARMSFTFALTLVARTSVNVVKTCTLLMENAEVIYQFRGNVSVHMLSKLKSPRLHSVGLRSHSSMCQYICCQSSSHQDYTRSD